MVYSPLLPETGDVLDALSLTDDMKRRHGIEDGWRVGVPTSVRWQDVDAFRHANHTTFLLWYEQARNLYLEAFGLPRLSADSPGPVMKSLEVQYLKPLAYHETVVNTVRVTSLGRTSLVMDYATWGDGCHCRCTAVLVLVINATGEKAAIPASVRHAIIELDGAVER